MKRYDLVDKSRGFECWREMEEAPDDGDWVLFEDHEAIIRRQASAARSGMDAAKAISSHQMEAARRLKAESSPDALESERQANAMLTAEIERLRASVGEYQSWLADSRHRNAGLREALQEIASLATPENHEDDERQFARIREIARGALPQPAEHHK